MYEVASQNNNVVANLPFGNSPLAVATAAKQGIVNILNAIKAITPLKVIPVVWIISSAAAKPSTTSSPALKLGFKTKAKVPRVEITFSFATRPLIAATANTQPNEPSVEPNPRGVNIGWINWPKLARIEFDIKAISAGFSLSISINLHPQVKWDVNQMIIVESKIIVKAFLTKCLVLSHKWIINDLNWGKW